MRARGLLITGATVVVLAGGLVVADGIARAGAQDRIATEVGRAIPGLAEAPEVTVDGFPFLTQVLAGELTSVRLTAPELTLDGLLLEDADVHLEGVSTTQPLTADAARLTGFTSLASVQGVVDGEIGSEVDLSIDGGQLVATTEVLGLPLEVGLRPEPAGRAIAVVVETLSLGGASVDAERLPDALTEALTGLTIPLDELPAGVDITGVTVEADGFGLEAGGSDVVVGAMP